MPLPSFDEIKTLIENPSSPCVSIYAPMVKAGLEVRQNPIRFHTRVSILVETAIYRVSAPYPRLDSGLRRDKSRLYKSRFHTRVSTISIRSPIK